MLGLFFARVGFGSGSAKENLGEYGSGWGWESERSTYTHAYDQTGISGAPLKYDGINKVTKSCVSEIEYTEGIILNSESIYKNQSSCFASIDNLGNLYSWPSSTVGDAVIIGDAKNTICAKGWQLPNGNNAERKGYSFLDKVIYNILDSASGLMLPTSYAVGGTYATGLIVNRSSNGYYWTLSSVSGYMAESATYSFTNIAHSTQGRAAGVSVRCVSR